MAADSEFRDSLLGKLAPLENLSCRSMFGGYGIFTDASMFGLISGSALFFKVDDSNLAAYEEAGSKKYGPMPYYRVPDAILEDSAKLLEWARASVNIAEAKPKKKRG
ncbi:MAG: TfoX/Sxy family protein [Dehalococcoidia bacterium]|nr:TfoX/Sxy family protein [Dehalococcoidia bacterium]